MLLRKATNAQALLKIDEEARAEFTKLHQRLQVGLSRRRQAQPPRRAPAALARRVSPARAK